MTLSRKAFIKHPTEKVIQLSRQDETSDFFLGVSACFGADAEVPRRPDDRHLVSIENLRIRFIAVMAWYHRCHLLLASIPFIQVVCRL